MNKQEEINTLAKIIQEHDNQTAKDRLFDLMGNFVKDIAKNYSNDAVSVEELVGAGWCGVETAISKWKEDRGTSFLTYSRWWIMDAIDKERTINSDLIAVPSVLRKNALRHLNDPTTSEPAHYDEAISAINASRTEERIGNERTITVKGSSESQVEGWYPKDDKAPTEEDMSLAIDVENLISRLGSIEQKIFCMRYGFNEEQVEYSNKEIAKTLGLTPVRVKHLLDKTTCMARECLSGYSVK